MLLRHLKYCKHRSVIPKIPLFRGVCFYLFNLQLKESMQIFAHNLEKIKFCHSVSLSLNETKILQFIIHTMLTKYSSPN